MERLNSANQDSRMDFCLTPAPETTAEPVQLDMVDSLRYREALSAAAGSPAEKN